MTDLLWWKRSFGEIISNFDVLDEILEENEDKLYNYGSCHWKFINNFYNNQVYKLYTQYELFKRKSLISTTINE